MDKGVRSKCQGYIMQITIMNIVSKIVNLNKLNAVVTLDLYKLKEFLFRLSRPKLIYLGLNVDLSILLYIDLSKLYIILDGYSNNELDIIFKSMSIQEILLALNYYNEDYLRMIVGKKDIELLYDTMCSVKRKKTYETKLTNSKESKRN